MHVVQLDVAVAVGIAIVEAFYADACVQQHSVGDRPVVLEVVGRIQGLEAAVHLVLARAHELGDAVRNGRAILQGR